MIERIKFCLLAWITLQALSVGAQTPSSLLAFLPSQEEVKTALFASPLIDMARSRKDEGEARALGIGAGSAEITLRATAQRRQDLFSGTQLNESMMSVERPFRFWGKRALDAELAQKTLDFSEIEYSDALHEGTRELMRYWFSCLKAMVEKKTAQAHLDLTQSLYRLAQVQFKQGEISRLDQQLASAEFERVKASAALANAQLLSVRSVFVQRYPAITLPTELPPLLQVLLQQDLPQFGESMTSMREDFLQKNHELKMMRIDAKRLQLSAQRASKDNLPDPTLGVFKARERSGAENISGLLLSVPLPGSAREYRAREVSSQAQAALDKVRLLEQQLAANFESMWIQFQNKREAVQSLRLAWQAQSQAADKSMKAYALGEGNLAQTLMISRLSSENLSAAERMNLDALELFALIMLDLHQMWDFDE